MFVLDASGGTGKSHSINLIQAAIRSKKKIAIATALSEIAAPLLSQGRTLHSRCKVPFQINETSMCNVSPQDATGVLFQETDLLIIDKISMGHKHVFESIDRPMQDIRKKIIAVWGTDCTFGWRLATNLTSCPTWIQA